MSLDQLSDSQLKLTGAWLPGTETDEYFPLPSDHVDAHQLEMCTALQGDAEVLLNTNPTGGGKTLSWAAPVIREGISDVPALVMATYPTTALIQDQRQTILELFRRYYGTDREPWASERSYDLTTRHDGADGGEMAVLSNGTETVPLEERVIAVSSSTGDESIEKQLKDAHEKANSHQETGLPTIILTTPDTLTLLATNRFWNNDVSRVVPNLDALIIDEFHLSTDRARRLLPFHLDVYNNLSGRYLDTFVFLSATPEPSYIKRIEQAFDPVHVSDTILDGQTQNQSSRQILPSTQLGVTSRPRFTSGRWLADNVDRLAAAHEPPGQMLVIVDSIREVEAVSEAFEAETDLSVGRVYGWKNEGRQRAIEESEVVIGNSAVEVGVDFDRVNRLICTGYEPNSTLQRIGRMRYRSNFDDYRTFLITNPSIHDEIVTESGGNSLSRRAFDDTLHNAADTSTRRPYYDVLCGAYTRYLWDHTDRSLDNQYVGKVDQYQSVAFDHFGSDFEQFLGKRVNKTDFWQLADHLISKSPSAEIFERLHSYRPSSLGCLVIDVFDNEEPLKSSSLYHILRHREGSVIQLDKISERFEQEMGRPVTDDEQAFLSQQTNYAAAGFVAKGRCEKPRDYYLTDFEFISRMEEQAKAGDLHHAIDTINNPKVTTDPGIVGTEHIDIDDGEVLAQYVPENVDKARAHFDLGPYAAIVPTPQGGCLLLGDDAIKAHAYLVSEAQ